MRTLALAAVLISLGPPVLLAGPEAERDIIWLKDGRKLTGIIRSETDRELMLLTLFKGRKGTTGGTAAVKLLKAEITRIQRMPAETRKRLLKKAEAFGSKRERRAEALKKIRPKSVRFQGKKGLHTVGTHFEVFSTCDDDFVREVTHYLDEVFAAYKQSFDIRRNVDRRIQVYVFADRAEYTRFQQRKFGGAFQNPAFYHIQENFIAAYNMVQKDEAAAIRKKILELEGEIKDGKKLVSEREAYVRKEASKARNEINAEASRVRRQILRDAYGGKTKRLKAVADWKRQELEKVDDWKRENKEALKKVKKKADAAIQHNRKIIAKNRKALLSQNRRMFELLFHESFHAFSRNFLWKGAVPRWLDEGFASYYEMGAVEVGELVHGTPHPIYVALLKKSEKSGRPLGIKTILSGDAARKFLVAHGGDANRSNLHYALSWLVAHYMIGKVPRERIDGYLEALGRGADPVPAFEAMMGRSVPQVEAGLRIHLQRLK